MRNWRGGGRGEQRIEGGVLEEEVRITEKRWATFGQALVQFMMVWQRKTENESAILANLSFWNSSWWVERRQVCKPCLSVLSGAHSTVYHPSVCLHQYCWSQVLVRVPPVGGTWGAATGTQNALVQSILAEREKNLFPSLLSSSHLSLFQLTSFFLSSVVCKCCFSPIFDSSTRFRNGSMERYCS